MTIDAPPTPFSEACTLLGEPVACDSNGQLRGAPRQLVWNPFFAETLPGFIFTPPNSTAKELSHTFSVTLNNPDQCRRMRGVAFWTLRATHLLGAGNKMMVGGGSDAAHLYQNNDDSTQQLFHEFVRTSTVDIAPGGSQAMSMDIFTDRVGGAISDVQEMRTTLRIMAVSDGPF